MEKDKIEIKDLKQYQRYLKALLYFFDSFCRSNDIKYSASCGTLIGAVRDHDIIAWDDDVDVMVTRDNLKKLENAFLHYNGRYYLNHLPDHIFRRNGKKDYAFIHYQIVDKKASNSRYNLDIFTMDFLGDDYKKAMKYYRKALLFWQLSKFSCTFHLPPKRKNRSFVQQLLVSLIYIFYPICFAIAWCLTPIVVHFFLKYDRKMSSNPVSSKFIGSMMFLQKKPAKNNWLDQGYIDLAFGKQKIMGIANYSNYLDSMYENYRIPPPENRRVPSHNEEMFLNCVIEVDNELESYLKLID